MKRTKLATAFALSLFAAGGALAQEIAGPKTAPQGAAPDLMCRPYEHIDGQLAYIKAELRITPAQEPQWSVFATVFREDKERQGLECRRAQEQNRQMMTATLPDSMKLKAQHLTQQLESLRKLEAAVQLFYDSLTKEQKKVADEIMKGAA